jgi:hypothetical protein
MSIAIKQKYRILFIAFSILKYMTLPRCANNIQDKNIYLAGGIFTFCEEPCYGDCYDGRMHHCLMVGEEAIQNCFAMGGADRYCFDVGWAAFYHCRDNQVVPHCRRKCC